MRIDRSAEVTEAIDLFSEIREIKSMTLEEAMKNAKVVERLQVIADQFPQHLSARMLLAHGKGVDGVKASLSGSLREITAVMTPFMEQYRTAMVDDTSAKEFKDMSDQAVARLSYLKDRVNGEAQGLHGISEEGRAVVTLEEDNEDQMAESMFAIQRLEGVLAASMIYHHREDDNEATVEEIQS